MSSGQEGIVAKDLINSPTRGLNDREFFNRPSSDTNRASLKRADVVEVPDKPLGEKFKDAVHEATEKAHEYAEAAEEKAYRLKDRAKEYMNESSDKARDFTRDAQVKGAVLADRAHRDVDEKAEKAKEYANQLSRSSDSSVSEAELREHQQKVIDAGKRTENALNKLVDATGEAMKNLGVKEKEVGDFKATDKSVEFGRGVRDQTAHSASRIHNPTLSTSSSSSYSTSTESAIPTTVDAPTTINSSEPFAPTENTTAVSESSYVPPVDDSSSSSSSSSSNNNNNSSSSGGVSGFLSSLFRASSPAPDVSADSFEQPLTSERAYGAQQDAIEAGRTPPIFDETSSTTSTTTTTTKSDSEPGLLASLAQSAKEWVSGTSDSSSTGTADHNSPSYDPSVPTTRIEENSSTKEGSQSDIARIDRI